MVLLEMGVETLLEVAPRIHAGLGIVCLVSGLIALKAKKVRGRHSNAGRIFGVSLVLTFVAILINIAMRKNVFMLGLSLIHI